jgi:hypothetical protein
MIKKIIIFIFVTSSSLLYGQSYKPTVVDGNRWNLLYHTYPSDYKCGKSISSDNYLRTEILKLSRDTTVCDTLYKILLTSFDSLSANWSITGFIREDNNAKKVYYRPAKIPHDIREQEEYLLYDFSLKLKDTMKYNEDYFNIVVDTIDTLKYDNIKYRRIKFNHGIEWLEGIGDLNGLLSTTMSTPCASPKPKLLCCSNNDALLYKLNSSEFDKCFYWKDYFSSITDLNNINKYDIYPNPADDKLMIHTLKGSRFEINIYNSQGQLMISEYSFNNQANINTLELPNGLYLIKLLNNSDVFNYKIIIKH